MSDLFLERAVLELDFSTLLIVFRILSDQTSVSLTVLENIVLNEIRLELGN